MSESFPSYDKTLVNPVSIRSHFLHSAPLIALGYNYVGEEGDSIQNAYTLLHEYLHYEDFTYWPILAMGYYWKTFAALNRVYTFRHQDVSLTNYENHPFYLWNYMGLPSSTNIDNLVDGGYRIHGEIGSDVMLEASALLNYRGKRKSDRLRKYSEDIIDYLLSDKVHEANIVHSIGVKLSLKAGHVIEEIFKRNQPSEEAGFLWELTARIPFVIATCTFGYSMILNGYEPKETRWEKAREFILNNGLKVWDVYTKKMKIIIVDVLLRHNFDEFVRLLEFRDISIIGYHCFVTVIYLSMYKYVTKLYSDNERLACLFMEPLQNILKLHEAENRTTLSRSGVPKLWAHWIPVPIIAFANHELNLIRIDFDNAPEGFFLLRWSQSVTDRSDFIYMVSWLRMLFYNELSAAISKERDVFHCPLWRWTQYQYHLQGCDDSDAVEKYLTTFCNRNMNFDDNLIGKSQKIFPSEQYCQCEMRKYTMEKRNTLCFFHCNMKVCMN